MSFFSRNGERVTGDIQTDDVRVPYGNLRLWSEKELAVYGVTVEEDPPPPPVEITDAIVREECKRRIFEKASITTQSNMNGYMNYLSIKARTEGLEPEEITDQQLFIQAMGWIDVMRATVPTLIGDENYTDDSKWPPLSPAVEAFAARY